ncbi:MAG: substrate-binding domain-containing protein, partial [Oscillospiraceae bacterium]|nr:substrate-binding domain-containing protein [Oscillospiraceae bacterium]
GTPAGDTPANGTPAASPDGTVAGAPEFAVDGSKPALSKEELSVVLAPLWRSIDGSTATIPLTTALHSYFGGAGDPPEHNTTSYAIYNLKEGNTDLIFVTHPSVDELDDARKQGVEYEIIPIVKDALVFLVNIENPVDNITLSQIQDVYTGNTVDWNALGGLDESIVPYQRTVNSGSQTLFVKLVMGGKKPMTPQTEWVATEMSELVEVVSNFKNSRNAIGYSMFYFVNNMFGNNRFKLLAVDGVKPSRDSISRGAYQLEDYYYAVIRKETPEDAPERKLINWLLTDEGQELAVQAGYIPLRPIKNVAPDSDIDPIYLGDVNNSSGTGGTVYKGWDAIGELVTAGVRKPLSDVFYDGFNYIEYLNRKIIERIKSDDGYSSRDYYALMRPFLGIPNNYPNYGLYQDGYLTIMFPEGNPFFSGDYTFYIEIDSDISPYGNEHDEHYVDYSVDYITAGQFMQDIGIVIPVLNMPKSPDIADLINERIVAWADELSDVEEKVALINAYSEWMQESLYEYNAPPDSTRFKLLLWPSYGKWRYYFSVSYVMRDNDYVWDNTSTLYYISFDLNTGETVDLLEKIPDNLDFSESLAFSPYKVSDDGHIVSASEFEEGYMIPEGSVIYGVWFDQGSTLYTHVVEPEGRVMLVRLWLDD